MPNQQLTDPPGMPTQNAHGLPPRGCIQAPGPLHKPAPDLTSRPQHASPRLKDHPKNKKPLRACTGPHFDASVQAHASPCLEDHRVRNDEADQHGPLRRLQKPLGLGGFGTVSSSSTGKDDLAGPGTHSQQCTNMTLWLLLRTNCRTSHQFATLNMRVRPWSTVNI